MWDSQTAASRTRSGDVATDKPAIAIMMDVSIVKKTRPRLLRVIDCLSCVVFRSCRAHVKHRKIPLETGDLPGASPHACVWRVDANVRLWGSHSDNRRPLDRRRTRRAGAGAGHDTTEVGRSVCGRRHGTARQRRLEVQIAETSFDDDMTGEEDEEDEDEGEQEDGCCFVFW